MERREAIPDAPTQRDHSATRLTCSKLHNKQAEHCPGWHRSFVMTEAERRLYVARTGRMPRVCLQCRIARRKQLAEATVRQLPYCEP
jgi:hypothetical protein